MNELLPLWALVDTSFWVGLFNIRDQWYNDATKLHKEIINFRLVINDYIIDETVTLLNRRTDFRKALTAYDYLTSQCRVLWLAPGELEACRRIFETYQGALSFTDAAIVHCMRREGLQYLLSFDRRFDRVEGLTRVHRPGQLAAPG